MRRSPCPSRTVSPHTWGTRWARTSSVLLTAAALTLGGCALLTPAAPEAQVKARAQARWDALAQRDFAQAYTLLAPSLRQLVPQDRWISRFGTAAAWKSADVVQVSCEATKCTATVRLQALVLGASRRSPLIETHLEETWVLEENSWWYFQRL